MSLRCGVSDLSWASIQMQNNALNTSPMASIDCDEAYGRKQGVTGVQWGIESAGTNAVSGSPPAQEMRARHSPMGVGKGIGYCVLVPSTLKTATQTLKPSCIVLCNGPKDVPLAELFGSLHYPAPQSIPSQQTPTFLRFEILRHRTICWSAGRKFLHLLAYLFL